MLKLMSCALAMAVCVGCPKADTAKGPARPVPIAAPAGGPSDADRKKAQALAHAIEVDAALPTFVRVERTEQSPARKVELWRAGTVPQKLRVNDVDDKGAVAHTTDFYFSDSRLVYVRHEQGLFMFENDSLLLWLDPVTQAVKRGVSPQSARTLADDLRETLRKELAAFR